MADDDDPPRTSWFGMGGRPRLPRYLRAERAKGRPADCRRLRGLDEFEAPPWKGRVRFDGDGGNDGITVGGLVRDTLRWLAVLAIGGAFVGIWWSWGDGDACVRIGGFSLGWC